MKGSVSDRLVACLLPRGVGLELQGRIFSEMGLARVDVHATRGFIGTDPAGLFSRVEKEILSVVVEEERAEEVFEWIYREARVAELEGRFLYMARLDFATPFELPADVPLEDAGHSGRTPAPSPDETRP